MTCKSCNLMNDDNGWCYKVDNYIANYKCWEEEKVIMRQIVTNPRRFNRYERKMRYKKKLKRLSNMNLKYPAPVYPVGDYDFSTDQWNNIKYYKRYYKANHAPGYNGFLKRQASKAFRRYHGELPNGCGYKKTFDYWWELT